MDSGIFYLPFSTEQDEQQSTSVLRTQVTSISDIAETEMDDLDDDFNEVIKSIDMDEHDVLAFDIPDNFVIKTLLEQISFKPEITETQKQINALVSQLQPDNASLLRFIRKLLFKMSSCLRSLKLDTKKPGGIPENILTKFYSQIHELTTGLEYIMSCLELFNIGAEQNFDEKHKIVCYRITEYIREYVIAQKVAELTSTEIHLSKRFITDSTKPRIRYVAGYCVASLRKRYLRLKNSRIFSSLKADQHAFKEAKTAVTILNTLKEEEHYLKSTTEVPESLVDIDRKQNSNRGLTNVTDSVFEFFISLTLSCLSHLNHENLIAYGNSMYNNCLSVIQKDNRLFEQFTHLVIVRLHSEEEFGGSNISLSEHLDSLVATAAEILHIYNELVRKYLMVFFAQFCRDIKSVYMVKKTMAHRKQIKVASSSETTKNKSSESSAQQRAGKQTQKKTKISANPHTDPTPGTSASTMDDRGSEPADSDSDREVCAKCKADKNDEWIQCDGCDAWLHRKCAGLSNFMKWRKYSKESSVWRCKNCE
ncbi:MAG: hypothetical protein AB2693_19565 [Candidatus Thiodiazotropha sp.]